MLDKIRGKICLENIEVCVEEKELVFKCILSDEKQLNIAAGKIHRNATDSDAIWSLSDTTLILRVPATQTALNFAIVHDAFKRMVS